MQQELNCAFESVLLRGSGSGYCNHQQRYVGIGAASASEGDESENEAETPRLDGIPKSAIGFCLQIGIKPSLAHSAL